MYLRVLTAVQKGLEDGSSNNKSRNRRLTVVTGLYSTEDPNIFHPKPSVATSDSIHRLCALNDCVQYIFVEWLEQRNNITVVL